MGQREGGYHTRDARGRSVRMLDPVVLHVLHRYETVDADTLDHIVEDLEPGTARFNRHAVAIVAGGIGLSAVGVAALYYFSDGAARADLVSTLSNPAIMVPIVVCCFVAPWIVSRAARMKRVRSVMLAHRRCPHCGYDLRGTPMDATDHATVCSECGCAWVLGDGAAAAEAVPAIADAQRRRRLFLVILLILLTGFAAFGALLAYRMAV